jgi:hypothetical protein
VTDRKFEVTQLVELFLGKIARKVYDACCMLYFYGALWSYSATFANSMSSHVGFWGIHGGTECDSADLSSSCHGLYLVYLAIFSCIVVPLACMNLAETKVIQVC